MKSFRNNATQLRLDNYLANTKSEAFQFKLGVMAQNLHNNMS